MTLSVCLLRGHRAFRIQSAMNAIGLHGSVRHSGPVVRLGIIREGKKWDNQESNLGPLGAVRAESTTRSTDHYTIIPVVFDGTLVWILLLVIESCMVERRMVERRGEWRAGYRLVADSKAESVFLRART